MSAAATTYVVPVPPVAPQLLPALSHRSQPYEKSTRYVLSQEPWVVVRGCPTCAVPVTVGRPEFVGPMPVPVTTEVAFDEAVPGFGSSLNALTWSRIVKPTSCGWSVYVLDSPLTMPSQFPAPWPPSGGQRRQLNLKRVGFPFHCPVVPESVSPTAVDPETVGSDVFVGEVCTRADPRLGTSRAIDTAATATSGSHSRIGVRRTRLSDAVIGTSRRVSAKIRLEIDLKTNESTRLRDDPLKTRRVD
jgi:hypothetical protein